MARASISSEFFRTTFEIMGHVAKSDGRVSEAEIDAARRLMQELRLGPDDIAAAITCFRTGKSAGYDANFSVERLRESCGLRYDLLRAFMDLQLRAALAGNGISPPARRILDAGRAAARAVGTWSSRAWRHACVRAAGWFARGGRQHTPRPRGPCRSTMGGRAQHRAMRNSTKAYRRQMSRHHPDKLVANGLPESMAQMAKEKTQRIQEAYEAIRAARGMR